MLYARIFQVALQAGTTVPAAEVFRLEVGPALKPQPGYVTSRCLTNATTNRCLIVMLWDNEAHRDAAEASGVLQRIFRPMETFFAGEPVIDYYEVAVQVF